MASDRLTLCMNLSNGAISQYWGYDFNSFAQCGDAVLGANEDGLFTLDDANTDNGTSISGWFVTPTTDFGSPHNKHFSKAKVGYESDSPGITLTVTADDLKMSAVSIGPTQMETGRDRNIIRLDRAAEGRNFNVRIENVSGCDFQVSAIDLFRSSQPTPVMRGSKGLNNKVPPNRLSSDPESDIVELAEAVNIDIDDRGEIFRRKGFTSRQTGSFHSLYSDGVSTYVIKERTSDAALYRVQGDFSLYGIRSSLTQNATMTFTSESGKTYYSNGYEKGVIESDVSSSWVAGTPHASELTVSRQFYDPPLGTVSCLYNGRIYMGIEDRLEYSEWGSYHRFRRLEGWIPFQGPVRMVAPVEDGIYVSDDRMTYFLQGPGAKQFRRRKLSDYAAVKGTMAYSQGSRLVGGQTADRVVIWTSTQGICAGAGGGAWRNLTENKLTIPPVGDGAGVVIGRWGGVPPLHMRYVVSLQP